ncbi:hypothetical protein SDC9_55667 [bioreactor metagenome]|uniref:Uncharacterized protein n=1 Tax=bioreactor metagenome TaxID=1076179 RepID=A0A644WZL4_9ZZZZ
MRIIGDGCLFGGKIDGCALNALQLTDRLFHSLGTGSTGHSADGNGNLAVGALFNNLIAYFCDRFFYGGKGQIAFVIFHK